MNPIGYLDGIPVYRSLHVPSISSRGHWTIGLIGLGAVFLSEFGWRVMSAEEEERSHLLAEAGIRDALFDERNQLEPFKEALQAFGVWQ